MPVPGFSSLHVVVGVWHTLLDFFSAKPCDKQGSAVEQEMLELLRSAVNPVPVQLYRPFTAYRNRREWQHMNLARISQSDGVSAFRRI